MHTLLASSWKIQHHVSTAKTGLDYQNIQFLWIWMIFDEFREFTWYLGGFWLAKEKIVRFIRMWKCKKQVWRACRMDLKLKLQKSWRGDRRSYRRSRGDLLAPYCRLCTAASDSSLLRCSACCEGFTVQTR